MSAPRVSIVLPTFNGAATLAELLARVRSQRAGFAFEVVAVDSGSTDGTLALLEGRVDRILQVPAGRFDHGATRNLGVERSAGELVVLLVQDAAPADESWLERLVAPLDADSGLAGTWARQLPRPDAGAVTRAYLSRWAGAAQEPRVVSLGSREEFLALAAGERLAQCTFDDVCSCVRREAWRRHPFRRTPIGEDLEWARDVLLAGWRLAFVPDAVVVHSHDRSPLYELKRTYRLHQRLRDVFGLRTIPTAGHLTRAVESATRAHLEWLFAAGAKPGPREIARAVGLGLALPLGQYLGGRSAERGREYLRAQGV